MQIPAHAPLHLLHQAAFGTLATHERRPEGFPYPSILPFALDARHRPTILVSGLAEHTRNLLADPRAGFLVAHAPDGDVLNGARVTLLGRFEPVDAAHAPQRRYLRYHPDARRYLALGDFGFWTLAPERMRYIGGFGSMGWLDGDELDPLVPIGDEEEAELLAFFSAHPRRLPSVEPIGVDRYGVDARINGARVRYAFDLPAEDIRALHDALEDCIERTRVAG